VRAVSMARSGRNPEPELMSNFLGWNELGDSKRDSA
jgi:hypothetical protein